MMLTETHIYLLIQKKKEKEKVMRVERTIERCKNKLLMNYLPDYIFYRL